MDYFIKQIISRIENERPQLATILNTLLLQFAIPNKEIRVYLSGIFYGIISVLATENVISEEEYHNFSDGVISEVFFNRKMEVN